jgi:hypothetical protein
MSYYKENLTYLKLQQFLLENKLKPTDTDVGFQVAFESFDIITSHLEKCLFLEVK